MKIGVNVEVMLVQVARRRRLKCSDWDGNPVDYLRGRVGNSSSRFKSSAKDLSNPILEITIQRQVERPFRPTTKPQVYDLGAKALFLYN
jgi:hypothetical protein